MRFDELDGEVKENVQHVGASVAPSIPTSTSVKEPNGAVAPTPNTLKFDDLEGEVSNEKKTETPSTLKSNVISPGEGGLQLMNEVKDKYIAPIGEWAQKNIGEPISRAIDKTVFHGKPWLQDEKNPGAENPIDKGDPNAVEGLMQQASSWIHGKDVKSQEMRSSIGRLVGPENIDAALKTASMFGQAPLWLALPGLPEIEGSTFLGKLGATFANGAANGVYGTVAGNALTKGNSLVEGVPENAVVGGLFGLGLGAIEGKFGTQSERKILGVVHSDGIDALGKELNELPLNTRSETDPIPVLENQPKLKEAGKNYEEWDPDSKYGPNPPGSIFTDEMGRKFRMSDMEDRPAAGVTKVESTRTTRTVNKASEVSKNYKPWIGYVDHEVDGPIINLHETSFNGDGSTSTRTIKIPLKNDTDALEFNKLKNTMIENGHEFPVNNSGLNFEEMGPLWNKNVFGEPKADVPTVLSVDAKGKMSADGMYTDTPSGQLSEGDIVDTHTPGQNVRQSQISDTSNGQIKTTDGQSLHAAQVSPAPELSTSDPQAQSTTPSNGHTIAPHNDVIPDPIPNQHIPEPGEIPDDLVDNFKNTINLVKPKSQLGSMWQKFKEKYLLQPEMSLDLPPNTQALIMSIKGEQSAKQMREVYTQAFYKQLGKNPSQEFGKALHKYMLDDSTENLIGLMKHPEWSKAQQFIQDTLRARSFDSVHLDNLMMKAGFGPLSTNNGAGLGEQYVSRFFAAHMDLPGMDQRNVAEALNLVEPAVQEELARVKKSGVDVPEHKIRSYVDNAIAGKGADTYIAQARFSGSKAFNNLKSRKDLGPAMRRAMGEVDDGLLSLPYTRAVQQALIPHFMNMEALAQDIEVTSAQEVPGWQKVPSAKQYGMMAGRYVRPDVWNMIKKNSATEDLAGIGRSISSYRKNMLMNPVWGGLHALSSHIWNSELAGIIANRPPDLHNLAGDVVTAMRSIYEYSKNPDGLGVGEIAKYLKQNGMLKAGVNNWGLEKNQARVVEPWLQKMEKFSSSDTPPNIFDLLKEHVVVAAKSGASSIGGLNASGKDAYNFLIDSIRASSWIAKNRTLLSRDHDGLYSNLARELTSSGAPMMAEKFNDWSSDDIRALAKRLASRSVKLYTSNPQSMAPIAQEIAKHSATGAVNVTVPLAENTRVMAQLAAGVLKNKNLAINTGSWLTLLGGIYGVRRSVQWLHGGMSPEVLDKAWQAQPDSYKSSHFMSQFGWTHSYYANMLSDSQGRVTYDGSSLPILNLIDEIGFGVQQGANAASTIAKMAQNLSTHVAPALQDPEQRMMNASGLDKQRQPNNVRPGESALRKLISTVQTASAMGILPKTLGNIANAWSGMNPDNPQRQEKLTLGQGAQTAMGLGRPSPVSNVSEYARRQEQNSRVNEAKRALHYRNLTAEERQSVQQNFHDTVNQRNQK